MNRVSEALPLQAWFRIPERSRLLLALAIALGLLLAGVVVGVFNERLYLAQKQRQVAVQAEILANSVTAALAFDDRASAQEYVNALRANPEIAAVGVYNDRNEPIASFTRPALGAGAGGRIVVEKPVSQAGTPLGHVHLSTLTEPPSRRMARYGLTAMLVVMAALVVAVFGLAQAALGRINAALVDRARLLAEANAELKVQMAEREKAEDALRQSQKMEAIGRLTGGVAHDFNNLLMVASSGLDLLDRTEDPARRERLKEGIRQAVERGKGLTRQLLAFSRRSALKPEVVDLAAKIEGMRVLLDRSLREDIAVDIRLGDGLWPVEVDAGQLEVGLLNVAVNARDAMPNGGTILISAENAPGLDEPGLSGDYVRLSVADTGVGMSPETLEHVFEPFFTTKEVGKGTGLGLSQVYGFSRASGGDVRVRSAPGQGTTISIYLPRSAKAPAAAQAAAPPLRERKAEGRVLLVEDDEQVAVLVTEMLTELGYTVRRVPNAGAALEVLGSDAAFDVMFSDMVMPGGMNGLELAHTVAERWPRLPILLTTGYSEAAAAAAQEGVRLLTKPYGMDALAREMQTVLASRRADASAAPPAA
jgi:signal transduction histidine kinase/ActR/RegA family two-component response regulator